MPREPDAGPLRQLSADRRGRAPELLGTDRPHPDTGQAQVRDLQPLVQAPLASSDWGPHPTQAARALGPLSGPGSSIHPDSASQAAVNVEPRAISTQNCACLSINSFFDHTCDSSHQTGVLRRPTGLTVGYRDVPHLHLAHCSDAAAHFGRPVSSRDPAGAGTNLGDVATAASISMGYLSEVERGLKEPSSEVLAGICRALEVDLEELLGAVQLQLRQARAEVVERRYDGFALAA